MAQRTLQEYERDMLKVVDDRLMADIVKDNRAAPRPQSTGNAKVQVVGAPVVRGNGKGWADSIPIKDWRAPGLKTLDALMDRQDEIDRAARIRELRETARALKQSSQDQD